MAKVQGMIEMPNIRSNRSSHSSLPSLPFP